MNSIAGGERGEALLLLAEAAGDAGFKARAAAWAAACVADAAAAVTFMAAAAAAVGESQRQVEEVDTAKGARARCCGRMSNTRASSLRSSLCTVWR